MNNLAILCSAPGWGGLEINTLKLALDLAGAGWSVSLFVRAGTPLYDAAAETQIHLIALPSGRGIFAGRHVAKAVARTLRSTSTSLLLTPYNKDIAPAALCKRVFYRGLKIVYQQHMKVGVAKRDFVHTLRYRALDAWIAPLEYLKQETMRLTRVPERRIHVIPFGIDAGTFSHNPVSRGNARAAVRIPAEPLLIGVLGRLDPKKGQDFLVRALSAWNGAHPETPAHLLIQGAPTAGEGDDFYQSLKQLITDVQLEDHVHLREHASDVSVFFAAIDVFAMPSQGETYGMVTLEAMASGVPVLGTDRDGTRELLEEGRLGYLHRPGDAADFCTRLEAVLKNQALAGMLEQARDTVVARYDEKAIFRRTDALLRALIA